VYVWLLDPFKVFTHRQVSAEKVIIAVDESKEIDLPERLRL
jgi:hypothetical protein